MTKEQKLSNKLHAKMKKEVKYGKVGGIACFKEEYLLNGGFENDSYNLNRKNPNSFTSIMGIDFEKIFKDKGGRL